MINKAQITRRADREGVPAKTVERDCILAHVVAGLAALDRDTGLVFKGGTALRLCYFEDYRYSADLDFSMTRGSIEDGRAVITAALEKAGARIEGLRLTNDEPPRIAYTGPLGRERTLKLDIADDELVLNTEKRPLFKRWTDLPENTYVEVYTLDEIAGEKLRCVLQRLQCRDLFDLWLLFDEAQVNPEDAASIFRQKSEHKGIDPDTFPLRYQERIQQYRERWESELREHVPEAIPPFEDLERRIARHLRRAGLL